MGKILSIIIGIIVIISGLALCLFWISDVIVLLKGIIPFVLLFGGLIALLAGISEFQDTIKEKK